MSAETLRRAASLMRSRAEAARDRFPDPLRPHGSRWISKPHMARRDSLTVQTEGEKVLAHYVPDGIGPHIASWHPAVALAVARWLDSMASRAESKIALGGDEAAVWSHERHALSVARVYLGESS